HKVIHLGRAQFDQRRDDHDVWRLSADVFLEVRVDGDPALEKPKHSAECGATGSARSLSERDDATRRAIAGTPGQMRCGRVARIQVTQVIDPEAQTPGELAPRAGRA